MSAEIETQIKAYVEAYDFGTPIAWKRGRNPKYPYVPVLELPEGCIQQTEQIRGLAYRTAAEAVAGGKREIEKRRQDLARKLADPRYRSLREWHGLPREI